ncbi:hypothetical protein H1Q63_36080 [Desmonostoc muscorum CCALA 125]|nr:hypothetical protein [Desmonostoc muscorum CCALA 125]
MPSILLVPWESLIKVYRKKLGNSSFPKLNDYCDDFINFIIQNINFFSNNSQKSSVVAIVYDVFEDIREEIRISVSQAFEDAAAQNIKIPKSTINKITDNVINQFYKNLENLETILHFSKDFINNLNKEYESIFEDLIEAIFEGLTIKNTNRSKLLRIAQNALVKNRFSSIVSGIVIAGFGEEEIFPSLHTYDIEAVFGNQLKYSKNEDKSHEIGSSYPVIIPFAQEDMISTFLEGIDPNLQRFSIHTLDQILDNYFETIIEQAKTSIPDDQPDFINQINNQFQRTKELLLDKYNAKMIKFRNIIHIEPILSTVSILPKDELAAMAEALVSLTSLKRRVTTDAETVGGPTDVALISKGDGFIWIKRKHYFSPQLNHDFFTRNSY